MANPNGNGLWPEWTYSALIQAAFRPEYYSSPELTGGYTQAENNFALIWGLAIQAYESTLVANDSRVDQFLEGRTVVLSALEQQGLNEFRAGGSQCTNCHNGAEITAAGISVVQRRGNLNTPANLGFFRIGVRPIADDLGLGANDGFGFPLFTPAPASAAGTFKAPGLRNVEFTGPYFHDGSQATLDQVLQFYARNGDFPDGGNLGQGIGNIRLNQGDRTAIVAFLKALSDDRVRFQRAPFDHPSLCVPDGHLQQSLTGAFELDPMQIGLIALDKWSLVSEVGKEGTTAPLQTFDELLNGVGNDGTRANTMNTSCKP
jgi:cytochrome c peroxidase